MKNNSGTKTFVVWLQVPKRTTGREAYSLILATVNGILCPYFKDTTEEGIRSTDFLFFLKGLRPFIRPYYVLVMDNAKIHRTDEIKDWALREDVMKNHYPIHSFQSLVIIITNRPVNSQKLNKPGADPEEDHCQKISFDSLLNGDLDEAALQDQFRMRS